MTAIVRTVLLAAVCVVLAAWVAPTQVGDAPTDSSARSGSNDRARPSMIAGGVGLGGACKVTSQCAGSLQCVRGMCGCTNNSQCSSKVAPGRPWCKNGMCQK